MLTANQFDKIKHKIQYLENTTVAKLTMGEIGEMLTMLKDLSAEIDRSRNVPQIGGKSHVKPLLLGADGKPVLGLPLVQQFAAERREQYAKDRHVALTLMTVDAWRVYALRWGLTPPPGGWEDETTIINMMHRLRLDVVTIPYIEKHKSAVHCTSNGIALPLGVELVNGELIDGRSITQETKG